MANFGSFWLHFIFSSQYSDRDNCISVLFFFSFGPRKDVNEMHKLLFYKTKQLVMYLIVHFSNSFWFSTAWVLPVLLSFGLVQASASSRCTSRSHLNECLYLLQFVMIHKLYLLLGLHSSKHHPRHTLMFLKEFFHFNLIFFFVFNTGLLLHARHFSCFQIG